MRRPGAVHWKEEARPPDLLASGEPGGIPVIFPDRQQTESTGAPEVPSGGSARRLSTGRFTKAAQYRRPAERPFTAAERDKTTILFGGLTLAHERFIKAVFESCGYRCEILPAPDRDAYHIGKEYCNNGQCNPVYFTAGSLIRFLTNLEARGYSREEIEDSYVFFTAGCCGPCRFGMYDSEYRLALENAGFGGFRVLVFLQDHGVRQEVKDPGLKFSLDLGFGMLNALNLGDVLNDLTCRIRPYEVNPGETDRTIESCIRDLCKHIREHKAGDLVNHVPSWLANQLTQHGTLRNALSVLYKFHHYLYSREYRDVLNRCRTRIDCIALDRTRVKPIVKITGEFWAQTTEGDGNYRMFRFLESEGAQVYVEPIGTWITYLLWSARQRLYPGRGLDRQLRQPGRWEFRRRLASELRFQVKRALLWCGEGMYAHEHRRVASVFKGLAHNLVSQKKLARLARDFYDPLARGGEGHLEVGKNIYYSSRRLCHMVLSLKPFGCMPSSQSDGVQSAVVAHHEDMIFLPVETSGDGEIDAYSRVQMALVEAKTKAKAEYQAVVAATGGNVEKIREFASRHPDLQKPFYPVPVYPGVAGVAANFLLHVSDLINGRARIGSSSRAVAMQCNLHPLQVSSRRGGSGV